MENSTKKGSPVNNTYEIAENDAQGACAAIPGEEDKQSLSIDNNDGTCRFIPGDKGKIDVIHGTRYLHQKVQGDDLHNFTLVTKLSPLKLPISFDAEEDSVDDSEENRLKHEFVHRYMDMSDYIRPASWITIPFDADRDGFSPENAWRRVMVKRRMKDILKEIGE